MQRFEKTLKMIEGGKVLDVGCYDGEFSVLIAERCTNLVAIDRDRGNILRAIETNQRPNITYREMDAECMWFEKEQFDCVIVAEVIEHLHNPYEFLKDVHKILKENGTLIISTPNATSITYILNLVSVGSTARAIRKLEKEAKGAGTEVDHIYSWGFLEIYRLLNETGFKYESHAFAGYYLPNIMKRFGLKGELKFMSRIIGRFGADIIIKTRKA